MLLRTESVCELLDCGVNDVDKLISESKLKTTLRNDKLYIDYNSVFEILDSDSYLYDIEYFTKKDGCISDYLYEKEINEIRDFNSLTMKRFSNLDFIYSDTFYVNPIVNYNTYDFGNGKKLDKVGITDFDIGFITNELLYLFSEDRIKLFNDVVYETQMYYNGFEPLDYSLMKFRDYTIIFHLDLFNDLGVTINSIYMNKDIEFKKDLPKKVSIPSVSQTY